MLTRRTVQWLRERPAEQPFFLYLAHRNIHGPIKPNARFQQPHEVGVYANFVAELDWSIGEVLKTLDETGLTDNTIVLFSSDNGGVVRYEPTERASINGHLVNGVLRGQKTDVYEGGVRVPLLARWPGHIPAGSTNNAMIALTDLLATFADFFQLTLPVDAGEDSYSFLGALLNQPARQVKRTTMVNDSFDGTLAIRRGPWKLILSQHGGGVSKEPIPVDPNLPPGQLFHLDQDLEESVNLYQQHPELVQELTTLLRQYQQSGRRRRPIANSGTPRRGVFGCHCSAALPALPALPVRNCRKNSRALRGV